MTFALGFLPLITGEDGKIGGGKFKNTARTLSMIAPYFVFSEKLLLAGTTKVIKTKEEREKVSVGLQWKILLHCK